jgi:hypothetical protein
MDNIETIRRRVDKIADKLGMPVDQGIKELVVAIQAQGLETSGSCEGHIGDGVLSIPWVAVETPGPEGWRDSNTLQAKWKRQNLQQVAQLAALLNSFNKSHASRYRLHLRNRGIFGAVRVEPAAHRETISPRDLEGYQLEMNAFAHYLLSDSR